MDDVVTWLYEALANELADAGHTPDDEVWTTAVGLLPGWTGSIPALHACVHVMLPQSPSCIRG
jgi:hypothetical protein